MKEERKRLGLVVPVHNRREITRRFIASLRPQTYTDFRLYLVDAGSTDGTSDLADDTTVPIRLVRGTSADWWTAATNRGVRQALADGCARVMTINDDALIAPDFLQRMTEAFERHGCDILSARIDFADEPGKIWALGFSYYWGSVRFCGRDYTGLKEAELPDHVRQAEIIAASAVCGDGVLVARSVYERIGLYDEVNCPHYHGDTEFALRANAYGLKTYVAVHVVVLNDLSDKAKRDIATAPPSWRAPFSRLAWTAVEIRRTFFGLTSVRHYRPVVCVTSRYCPPHLRARNYFYVIVRPLLRLCVISWAKPLLCSIGSPRFIEAGRRMIRKAGV